MGKKKKQENIEINKDDLLSSNIEIYNELKREDDSIMDADKVDKNEVKYWISTSSFLLDAMITNCYRDSNGIFRGGIAGGKIVSISGEEGVGKSILAAHLLKSAQEQNAVCMFIDSEQAVNRPFFESIGIDFDKSKLIYTKSNIIENNFNLIIKLIEKMIESKNPDRLGIIIWDSIASTTTLQELEEKFGEGTYGYLAKQISIGMRKLNGYLNKHNIALVFTNQLRLKFNASKYEDPFIEPGGKAVPFYSSLSFRLLKPRKADKILNAKGQQVGSWIRLRFQKSRYGPPQDDFEIPMYYGRGIDEDANWYFFLKENKFITSRKDNKLNTEFSIISIPNIAEEKIETKNWKKWLNENEERKNKLKDFLLDFIKIDLDSDEFCFSVDKTEDNIIENNSVVSEENINNVISSVSESIS